MSGIDALFSALNGMDIERNVLMRSFTTFRIGGIADAVLRPSCPEQLIEAVNLCREYDVPLHVMGNGSNILVRDEGLRGLVIVIGEGMSGLSRSGNEFTAGAGMTLTALSRETISCGFQGLEWATGIPGTVGGACAMNAGAYGGEIKNELKSVKVIGNFCGTGIEAGDLTVEEMPVTDGDMGYRKSAFAYPDRIVVSATFALLPDDGHAKERQEEYTARRKEKQPLREYSAGSVFKRPDGHYTGALIEGAGLKGISVGGAKVSEKHAGFIVNTGEATASDVLKLIEHIQSDVYKKYGVTLERELKVW